MQEQALVLQKGAAAQQQRIGEELLRTQQQLLRDQADVNQAVLQDLEERRRADQIRADADEARRALDAQLADAARLFLKAKERLRADDVSEALDSASVAAQLVRKAAQRGETAQFLLECDALVEKVQVILTEIATSQPVRERMWRTQRSETITDAIERFVEASGGLLARCKLARGAEGVAIGPAVSSIETEYQRVMHLEPRFLLEEDQERYRASISAILADTQTEVIATLAELGRRETLRLAANTRATLQQLTIRCQNLRGAKAGSTAVRRTELSRIHETLRSLRATPVPPDHVAVFDAETNQSFALVQAAVEAAEEECSSQERRRYRPLFYFAMMAMAGFLVTYLVTETKLGAGFMQPDSPVARISPEAPSSSPAQSAELFVNVGTLNVRDHAETGAIVGKLSIATRCERRDANRGDWVRIRCGAVEGWAKSEYLSATAPTTDNLLPRMRNTADPKESLQLALNVLAIDSLSLEAEAYAEAKFLELEWAALAADRRVERATNEMFEHACGEEDPISNCVADALAAKGIAPDWLRVEVREDGVIILSEENGELFTRGGAILRDATSVRFQPYTIKHYKAAVMIGILSGSAGAPSASQQSLGPVVALPDDSGCRFAAQPDAAGPLFVHDYGDDDRIAGWVHAGGRDAQLTCSKLFDTKGARPPRKCVSPDGSIDFVVRYVPAGRAGYEWQPLKAIISGRVAGQVLRLHTLGGCGL